MCCDVMWYKDVGIPPHPDDVVRINSQLVNLALGRGQVGKKMSTQSQCGMAWTVARVMATRQAVVCIGVGEADGRQTPSRLLSDSIR